MRRGSTFAEVVLVVAIVATIAAVAAMVTWIGQRDDDTAPAPLPAAHVESGITIPGIDRARVITLPTGERVLVMAIDYSMMNGHTGYTLTAVLLPPLPRTVEK